MRILSKCDSHISDALKEVGNPAPRIRPAGFATLLNTIVSQQISTYAAAAIMERVERCVPDLTAANLLLCPDERLREAGLSWRKIEYAKGLSQAIISGQLDVNRLEQMDDAEAIDQIVALKGFGRWSAEIYLMFSLGRKDLFPADDLALRVALMKLKGLPDRPTPKESRILTEHWSPWRSVGSLFLWHFYRGAPT